MLRIAISTAAFDAIDRTMSFGGVNFEAGVDAARMVIPIFMVLCAFEMGGLGAPADRSRLARDRDPAATGLALPSLTFSQTPVIDQGGLGKRNAPSLYPR
jgi:hypothetical protein